MTVIYKEINIRYPDRMHICIMYILIHTLNIGLNFSHMEAVLRERDILLNVVVWADYKLRDDPNAVILGVDYSGVSYVLEPAGRFSVSSGRVEITGVSIEG